MNGGALILRGMIGERYACVCVCVRSCADLLRRQIVPEDTRSSLAPSGVVSYALFARLECTRRPSQRSEYPAALLTRPFSRPCPLAPRIPRIAGSRGFGAAVSAVSCTCVTKIARSPISEPAVSLAMNYSCRVVYRISDIFRVHRDRR